MKVSISERKVQEILLDKGWTYSYLARRIGRSPSELSRLLKRRSNTFKSIHLVATGLGMSWRDIVNIEEDKDDQVRSVVGKYIEEGV